MNFDIMIVRDWINGKTQNQQPPLAAIERVMEQLEKLELVSKFPQSQKEADLSRALRFISRLTTLCTEVMEKSKNEYSPWIKANVQIINEIAEKALNHE